MSRNLLLKSGRLYAWHSSDAKSYVDISTPGIVTKTKEGGAGLDVSGMTEWTRVHLTVPLVQTKGKATSSLFCVFFADDSPAGGSVQWRNMKLEVGDTGSEWTPAPEEATCTGFFPDDFEQATVNEGVSAGSSWAQQLIPLSDHFGMYVNPGYYVCLCEFGSNGYLGKDTGFMNWSTGWVYRELNSETTHVGICFRKADSSAITPEDVTNVTGGGTLWQL